MPERRDHVVANPNHALGDGGTTKGIVRRPIDARLWVWGEVVSRWWTSSIRAGGAAPPWSIVLWHVVAMSRSSSVLNEFGSLFTRPPPAERNLAGLAELDRPAL
jgi:hypothetical protein